MKDTYVFFKYVNTSSTPPIKKLSILSTQTLGLTFNWTIFFKLVNYPGGNISQNFSEIIFDFLIFQFSEKFWEIF